MIYFDNAATTPLRPEAIETIDKVLRDHWGNPSSLHHMGFEAEKIMEGARRSIAENLGVMAEEIIFTGSATEANNMVLQAMAAKGPHANLVISPVEHDSILNPAKLLAQAGLAVRVCPVDAEGRVDPQQVADLVDEETVLVSIMHVNNELGTIEPIEAIGPLIKQKNPKLHFHVDNVQGLGKVPLDLKQAEVDSFSASAHKLMGPKGVGFLYLKQGRAIAPLIRGGGQERGQRSGTENVAYIAGMAKALDLQLQDQEARDRVVRLNQAIRQGLSQIEGVHFNSPETGVSPYILNVAFTGLKAEVLLHSLEEEEIYVSTGSACSLGAPSHVLQAIQLSNKYADGSIRISFQAENREEEAEPFLEAVRLAVADIRRYTGRGGRG